MNIVWTAQARKDVDEIVDYIAKDNLPAAIAVSDRIEHRIGSYWTFLNPVGPARTVGANLLLQERHTSRSTA